MATSTHIALVTLPVFSHEASVIELCKRLVRLKQHVHVTCIFPTIGTPYSATTALLQSLPSTIHYIFLPPINMQDLKHLPPFVQVLKAVSQSMPLLRNALSTLCSTTSLAALVVDAFANEALDIAKEFNLSSYIYFTCSAMTMSVLLYLPTLNDTVSGEYRDRKEAIQVPGCIPIQGHDLPSDCQDRSSPAYVNVLQRCKNFSLADGFMVNSIFEMEQDTVITLQKHFSGKSNNNKKAIYPVGPIIPGSETGKSECLKWLENQSVKSVLYVSFGSGATLSQKQINELAFGLELSGQKFIWVLRPPNDIVDAGLLHGTNKDPLQFLPGGFLERTEEQGLVVPSWAPQIQILNHASTGGFLTHCGWNSTLESIAHGVPMITWPLFAEQRLNAVLLTQVLKVALRPKFDENGIAKREEIAKVIKGLMISEEGNEMRRTIMKLKDAAADALKEDGSSTKALSQFAATKGN